MKLNTFWVVTKPTRESTLGDICFEVEPVHFIRQVKGGLDESDEPEFYTDAKEAYTRANHLLSKQGKKVGLSARELEFVNPKPFDMKKINKAIKV